MKLTFSHGDLKTLVENLGRKLGDMKPAFERIRKEILEPMAASAWAASGVASRSGALRKAVLPWHRARSAGVRLKARKSNRDLTLAKADVLQKGRRKHQHRKRSSYEVRSRSGNVFSRRNAGSPWGAIKPRVFMPQRPALMAQRGRIERMLAEHLRRS